jgi:hypothetical protein
MRFSQQLLNRVSQSKKDKLPKEEFIAKKLAKNMFWKLNKHPEQLYGLVLPSVIG